MLLNQFILFSRFKKLLLVEEVPKALSRENKHPQLQSRISAYFNNELLQSNIYINIRNKIQSKEEFAMIIEIKGIWMVTLLIVKFDQVSAH